MFGVKTDITNINEGGSNGLEAGVYEVRLSLVKIGFGSKKNGFQLGFNLIDDNSPKPNINTKAWWFSEKTTNADNKDNLFLNPNVVATYFATKVLGMTLDEAVSNYNDTAVSMEGVQEWWDNQIGTSFFALVTREEEEGTDGNIYTKSFIRIGSISGVIDTNEEVCKASWETLPDSRKNVKLQNVSPTEQTSIPTDDEDEDIEI